MKNIWNRKDIGNEFIEDWADFFMEKEYSLWLVPESRAFEKFCSVITRLSVQYGCPNFDAHLTLLAAAPGSEEEVIQKTRMLSRQIMPVNISFDGLAKFHEYYKSLFMKAKETSGLLEANRKAQEAFGVKNPRYFPHLSLMYSNSSDDIKRKICEELPYLGSDIVADKLELVMTAGGPRNWQKMESFFL